MPSSAQQFWQRFRAAHPDAPPEAPAIFHFCDNAVDADSCAALVLEGRKTATAPALAELRLAGECPPKAGDLAIVTNWAGEPKAAIRTSSVEIRRFADVDEPFAQAEGEGDGTLAWWRTAHRAYYERVLAGSGEVVDDDLQIVCERFSVLFAA